MMDLKCINSKFINIKVRFMDIQNYMGLEAILNFNDFKVKIFWWICQIQILAYFKTI